MREVIRSLLRTTTVIASIVVAIVLLFMAPKGFELSAPDPIVAGSTDTAAGNSDRHLAARPGRAGGNGLAGLAGLIAGLTG